MVTLWKLWAGQRKKHSHRCRESQVQVFTSLHHPRLKPTQTNSALYKSRWPVELFFKLIKQHLRIKHCLGNSENAVKTQVWCAVATYLLIAIVKKELQLEISMYTCVQILSVSVFEKTKLLCALRPGDSKHESPSNANQLILFNF